MTVQMKRRGSGHRGTAPREEIVKTPRCVGEELMLERLPIQDGYPPANARCADTLTVDKGFPKP
jgi:hypothetical protein